MTSPTLDDITDALRTIDQHRRRILVCHPTIRPLLDQALRDTGLTGLHKVQTNTGCPTDRVLILNPHDYPGL